MEVVRLSLSRSLALSLSRSLSLSLSLSLALSLALSLEWFLINSLSRLSFLLASRGREAEKERERA